MHTSFLWTNKDRKATIGNFFPCTMHYGIYIFFIHQQLHFLLNLEKFNFTLEYT